MKYFEPSVVIVDDKKEEIEGLIDHYHTQGIGCKYFNADLNDGDSYPDKPMSDVMLLFLDLYLYFLLNVILTYHYMIIFWCLRQF